MKHKSKSLFHPPKSCAGGLVLGFLILCGISASGGQAIDNTTHKPMKHYNPKALNSDSLVNVLKDWDFEEENFRVYWSDSIIPEGVAVPDSMEVEGYDTTDSYQGRASASIDARKNGMGTQLFGWLRQHLKCKKATQDLRYLKAKIKVKYRGGDILKTQEFGFIVRGMTYQLIYDIFAPSLDSNNIKAMRENDTIGYIFEPMLPRENVWDTLWDPPNERNVSADWQYKFPIHRDSIRTFYIWGSGRTWESEWYGQKSNFDNVVFMALKYYDPATLSIDVPDTVEGECIPKATVTNYGKVETEFEANCVIRRGTEVVYTSSKTVSAGKDEHKEVEFDKWTVGSTDLYQLLVYTSYENDEDNSNDSLEITIYGKGEPCDPAVDSIIIPPIVYIDTKYVPKAIVTNHGAETSFPVGCRIKKDDKFVYTSDKTVSVAKDEKKEVRFDEWEVKDAGTHNVLVYVFHQEDKDHTNDSLEITIEASAGIAESPDRGVGSFSVLPFAKGCALMRYNLPEKRELKIYDTMGRLIKGILLKGEGEFYFKAETGVYFYQLDGNLPKKLILLK